MANAVLKTYIPNMGPVPTGSSQFKAATPQIDWWESKCQAVGARTMTHGVGGTFNSTQAYGPGSIQDNSRGGIWQDNPSYGWGIKNLNNGNAHTQNIEIFNNDKNRWMPAGMFYGMGFYIYQNSGSKQAMYLRKFALIWKAVVSGSTQYRFYGEWAPGKNDGPSQIYKYCPFNNSYAINEIQNWGWNWHLYGVLLNLENDGKAGSTTSSIFAYDFKFFHRGIANVSSNRILVPGHRHFNDRYSPNVWGT